MSTLQSTQTPADTTFKGAFEATAAARAALPAEEVYFVNADVQVAAETVIGTLPRIATLRADIAKLDVPELAQIDHLETYARAAAYAQSVYNSFTTEAADGLQTLATHAMELRDTLLADAKVLARRKVIDASRLGDIRGGNAYLNVVSDIGMLARVIRGSWESIGGKTMITEAELHEAEQLFEQMTNARAARAVRTEATPAAADDRARAFTLLVKAYSQARRAAAFIKWDHADARTFLPSLWKGRGRRPADNDPEVPESPVDEIGEVPTGESPVIPVEPGMPGGSPFA